MSCAMWSKAILAGCGVAVALSAGACSRDEAADIDRDTDGLATSAGDGAGHEGAPITLTGCLQRGTGLNTYILTQANSPVDSPVATSGQGSSGDTVQREQMREARHAYELDGHGDELRDLVGTQVRVTGTLEELSDLREKTDAPRGADRGDGLDIGAGDLAKVDVEGVVKIADACGDQR